MVDHKMESCRVVKKEGGKFLSEGVCVYTCTYIYSSSVWREAKNNVI